MTKCKHVEFLETKSSMAAGVHYQLNNYVHRDIMKMVHCSIGIFPFAICNYLLGK